MRPPMRRHDGSIAPGLRSLVMMATVLLRRGDRDVGGDAALTLKLDTQV